MQLTADFRGNIRILSLFLLLFVLVISSVSCGRLKGRFAFRFPPEQQYRLIPGNIELSGETPMEWVFMFNSVRGRTRIGVILEKKEVVPVEVMAREEIVLPESPAVYGSVAGLKPGDYRLILTDIEKGNFLVADREFIVYSSEELEELPLD